ncbi:MULTISPECIES: U6 snRNA-associated Sm-like protein LSm6 [Acidilobus]|uniref:Putative small nucleolar RNP protein Sm n=1 Tax=Acidilobus saccharovorans (strain DSM 16705 / JCM 18335 / VKM B-2471 / 345-15) TaxID=666510 RepID=D9Q0Y5_ACIS3|nr:U6 snRNA-associated Sm-like protein LSm6 [Acidilobus saccharovorans]ADL18973.1 Putative small nucleolar RNP protein Sm [Acidilobus saccharovorans 345-15]
MAASQEKRVVNPLRYLRDAVDSQIYVKLKDGTEYVGQLLVTDSTMNLVLDNSVEVKDGKQIVARLGKILIRGSMVQYVSFNPELAAPDVVSK